MIYRYKAYGLVIKSQIEIEEFVTDINYTENYDVDIILGNIDDEMKNLIDKGEITVIKDNESCFYIKGIGTFYIKGGNKIIVQAEENSDINEIKSYLVGTCMGDLLYQRGVLAIHGSSLVNNNKAILIVGDSGSGKSTLTTAFRLRGYKFLSDDLSPLIFGDKISVNYGYPGQKLCDDSAVEFGIDTSNCDSININKKHKYTLSVLDDFVLSNVNLKAIFEIQIGNVESVNIKEIKGGEKLELIFKNIYGFYLNKKLGVSPLYFKQCLEVSKKIPIYKITRPKKGITVDRQILLINDVLSKII